MQLKTLILFPFTMLIALALFGQEKNEYTQSRILILLDESSSMIQPWAGGREKIKVANDLILNIMDSVYSVNPEVEFSLRVFGNQHTVPEHDCTDTKNEVAFSKYNKAQMEFRLDDLHPQGMTPIAYSLSEAAEKDLVDEKHNAYSIVLITDGGESCGGNICDVMDKLIRNKVYFKPYILNLEEDPEIKKEYSCMGDYLQVTRKSDIAKAVGTIVEAFRPMLKMTKSDYTALQTMNIPSPLKVKQPVIKPAKTRDTVAPAVVPIAVDTVTVAHKPVPEHTIKTGIEAERPKPEKLTRIKPINSMYFFTYSRWNAKLQPLAITIPNVRKLEPDVLFERPTPVKLTLIPIRNIKKLKITRSDLPAPEPFTIVPPGIKILQPDIERPVPAKLTELTPRPLKKMKVAKPEFPLPGPAVIQEPEIKLLQPDIERPVPAKLTALALRPLKKMKITRAELITPLPVTLVAPGIKPLQADVVYERPVPAKLTALSLRPIRKMKMTRAELQNPLPVNIIAPKFKPLEPDVVAEAPTVEKPAKLPLKKTRPTAFKMHLLYGGSFFDADLKPVKLPPPPEFKPMASSTPATPVTPKPVAKTPTAKTGEYTVEHEDATETTLEIYLTNGKGKFYSTTPQVVITDPATDKEIKKFYRFVDAAGNPDPITNLPAGKYDLSIVGRDDLLAHIELQNNKKNKVYIKVKNFSLYFYYYDAQDRPVNEFSAMVIQRNVSNGKQIVQKCTERLEYEPGNYHIIINTFPEDVRNIDLDAESAGAIGIYQPGFVKFTSQVPAKSVVLWKQTGEKYLSFYTLNLDDPSSQHLQIQPGKYQVQYNNGTSGYSSSDKVIPFEVKSNKETEVILVK